MSDSLNWDILSCNQGYKRTKNVRTPSLSDDSSYDSTSNGTRTSNSYRINKIKNLDYNLLQSAPVSEGNNHTYMRSMHKCLTKINEPTKVINWSEGHLVGDRSYPQSQSAPIEQGLGGPGANLPGHFGMDNASQLVTKRPHRPGSFRRRFKYWLAKGLTREEADVRALLPLMEFPEYRDDVAKGLAGDQGGMKQLVDKRPSTPESFTEEQPNNKTPKFSGPPRAESAASLKVGIRDANRDITDEMATGIEKEILHFASLDGGGSGPRFMGFTIREGVLMLTCRDVKTRSWLVNRVQNFEPWEGASLSLIDEKDLPKSTIVVAFVPDIFIEPSRIIRQLHVQNVEMGCDRWRLLHSNTDSKGQYFYFGLDATQLRNLQRDKCMLHLGMRLIQCYVKGHEKEVIVEGSSESDWGSGGIPRPLM